MMEVDQYGRTKLHYVALDVPEDEQESETLRLIEAGYDVNLKDKQGWSPLHFAAQEWSEKVTRKLLENGAEVDIQDNRGDTPLMKAVFESRGRGDVIKLLLDAGADPDKGDNDGDTPRDLAEKIANFDVLQHLPPKG